MKKDIVASVIKDTKEDDDSELLLLDQELFNMRKNWTVQLDKVIKDKRGSKK